MPNTELIPFSQVDHSTGAKYSNMEDYWRNQNTVLSEVQSGKVDKIAGKGLSANDFTNEEKTKADNAVLVTVQSLTAGQQKQVQNNIGFGGTANAGRVYFCDSNGVMVPVPTIKWNGRGFTYET